MAIASSSVLKLVRNVQRIGKKMRKATTQARIVTPMRSRADFFMAISSALQIPADHAHQEDGDDVSENDGDDAARGGAADIEVEQRLLINKEGNIRRRDPGAAGSGHVDFREHA